MKNFDFSILDLECKRTYLFREQNQIPSSNNQMRNLDTKTHTCWNTKIHLVNVLFSLSHVLNGTNIRKVERNFDAADAAKKVVKMLKFENILGCITMKF